MTRSEQADTLYKEATLFFYIQNRVPCLIYAEVVVGQLRAMAIIQSSRTI